jgi:hypothetical protein
MFSPPLLVEFEVRERQAEQARKFRQAEMEGRVRGSRRSQKRRLPLVVLLKSMVTFFI